MMLFQHNLNYLKYVISLLIILITQFLTILYILLIEESSFLVVSIEFVVMQIVYMIMIILDIIMSN